MLSFKYAHGIIIMLNYYAIIIMHKATPNGCLVSGPDDFQIGMRAGSNCHYNIIPFSDEKF